MSVIGDDDQYFTHERRLASFQKTTKKRGSAANGRGAKALNWPHKQIAPDSLAKAGFFFNPSPENPDNATCFLCQKGLDGWEAGDDPLVEHLKHSDKCGWAIVAAIEAEIEGYQREDPTQSYLVEARKATFAEKWPHEGKRGWKCKTKQLVEAGWKYTPSLESDDMATCAYCQLALDGWEQNDKPLDEHYNRAPDCPFFTLSSESRSTKKKTARGKGSRASKASRLSTQSTMTAMSDMTSVIDLTAATEDSVLTTATNMTGGKKTTGKKSAASKSEKSKAKDDEPTEIEETTATIEDTLPLPHKKATRGKKRGSDAVDSSTLTAVSEAPAAKRRATGARVSAATVDGSTISPEDGDTTKATASKKPTSRKKGTKSGRKTSTRSYASMTSTASLREPTEYFPDDDEIERQLQADLDMIHSDDEVMEHAGISWATSDEKAAASTAGEVLEEKADFAMFDPASVEHNDAEVEDELNALQAEMEVVEPEQLKVQKKGRKAGPRKVSKQTKAKAMKAASPDPLEEDVNLVDLQPQRKEDVRTNQHVSMGSTDTAVKGDDPSPASNGKKSHGRPPKTSMVSLTLSDAVELAEPIETIEPPMKRKPGRPSKASINSQNAKGAEQLHVAEAPAKRARGRPPKMSSGSSKFKGTDGTTLIEAASRTSKAKAEESPPLQESDHLAPAEARDPSPTPMRASRTADQTPLTPGHIISPTAPANCAVLSPSQSPQSSDAENQPPSSRPAESATTKRVALGPLTTATPMRGSPTKRNVIAGLHSTAAWTAVDLDAVLGTPWRGVDKENSLERLFKQGSDLSSPEKRMTVEEWVYFNAGEAERKLKHECETMVNRFETEGSKAINVLEGLSVE